MDRQYWLMLHTSMSDTNLAPFPKAIHGSILELSMDGLVSIWPVSPHSQTPGTHELCEVCLRFLHPTVDPLSPQFIQGCLSGREEGDPCAFDPAPEAEEHQDFDNLLIDGSPTIEDGYYYGPSGFLRAHGLSSGDFLSIPLGTHPNIRACRDFFSFCID